MRERKAVNMEIRLMSAEDYGALYRLWAGTPGMGLRSLDDSAQGIARFLARNPTTCFIACEGPRLVGSILCGHDGRRGYIYHTAVDPQSRQQGVGRALVNASLCALRQEGIHKAALLVFRRNRAGNDFWEALGFEAREDICYRNLSLSDENV